MLSSLLLFLVIFACAESFVTADGIDCLCIESYAISPFSGAIDPPGREATEDINGVEGGRSGFSGRVRGSRCNGLYALDETFLFLFVVPLESSEMSADDSLLGTCIPERISRRKTEEGISFKVGSSAFASQDSSLPSSSASTAISIPCILVS